MYVTRRLQGVDAVLLHLRGNREVVFLGMVKVEVLRHEEMLQVLPRRHHHHYVLPARTADLVPSFRHVLHVTRLTRTTG